MRRRDLLKAAACAAVALPFCAHAQQPTRVARVAYLGALSPATLDPRQIEAFREGLLENGLIDGGNIRVDYFWANGSEDRLRQLANDLAKQNLDVIVTAGPQAVLALKAAGTTTPIVFAVVGDAPKSCRRVTVGMSAAPYQPLHVCIGRPAGCPRAELDQLRPPRTSGPSSEEALSARLAQPASSTLRPPTWYCSHRKPAR